MGHWKCEKSNFEVQYSKLSLTSYHFIITTPKHFQRGSICSSNTDFHIFTMKKVPSTNLTRFTQPPVAWIMLQSYDSWGLGVGTDWGPAPGFPEFHGSANLFQPKLVHSNFLCGMASAIIPKISLFVAGLIRLSNQLIAMLPDGASSAISWLPCHPIILSSAAQAFIMITQGRFHWI